jgi:uncharacterized protein (TIGR02145 family)
MNKDNVMKSSPFFMDDGDVLHMLFLDEAGTTLVTVDLVTEESADAVPNQPVAIAASNITSASFTANWNLMENSTGYYLDVATDSAFTSILAGYNNHDCGNNISHAVIGLTDGINYYYRVRAYNDTGTSISSEIITTTTTVVPVIDADGNSYTYVQIGTQQWFIENLKTTKYADGTAIPTGLNNANWILEDGTVGHDGAYAQVNNDAGNKAVYGLLYNFHAVNNARGLAPTGWRVPTRADNIVLSTFLGGDLVAGGKLKEMGISHWIGNFGATDEVGFKAVGSGWRNELGNFAAINQYCYLWTSDYTYPAEFKAAEREINAPNTEFIAENAYLCVYGLSVRCMRDI